MAIDKALYQAPVGIDAAAENESPIEIDIEDPESVGIHADGLDVILEAGDDKEEEGFNDNLAEYLNANELSTLAGDLVGDFDDDVSSRKDWIQTYVDGLELLGLKIEERAELLNVKPLVFKTQPDLTFADAYACPGIYAGSLVENKDPVDFIFTSPLKKPEVAVIAPFIIAEDAFKIPVFAATEKFDPIVNDPP